MNITEELLQARDRIFELPENCGDNGGAELRSVLFRAASTIQTLEAQVKESEATATRCTEALAGRTATLRFISVITLTYWLVIDTERKLVMATCAREQDANEIAALLNKA